MDYKVHTRRFRIVTRTLCSPTNFALEEYKTESRENSYSFKQDLLCGITQDLRVGTRFVINNGIAEQLPSPEALSRQRFAANKGLSRAASVYYSLAECTMIARLIISTPDRRNPAVFKTHLSLFRPPKGVPIEGTVTFKELNISPGMAGEITMRMMQSIKERGILVS